MYRVVFIFYFISFPLFSQENNNEEPKVKIFNPKKASKLSAILPGLGQVYNKQYWKIPVIYGGYTVIGHYIKFNNGMYQEFKQALTYETDNDEFTLNPFPNFNRNSLERNMDYWRRNRDLLIIFSGVYYLLNIVDAHIFAHLKDFNTDNDLSIKFQPSMDKFHNTNVVGISIYINF